MLRNSLVSGVFFALACLAGPANADEAAPRWEVGEICASSRLGAQCPRIESQNRSTLLLRWEAVPAEDRKACKASIADTPSYKLLLTCIEDRKLKALDVAPHSANPQRNES
ncbi:MAG TPA: hypothetical protein PLD46_01070 [Hyphomicrobium sp.]|nr:hypothetical protein [Hyphomicrobium sp.]